MDVATRADDAHLEFSMNNEMMRSDQEPQEDESQRDVPDPTFSTN